MTSLAAAPGAIDATGHAVASTRILPLRSITSTTTLGPERRMAMSGREIDDQRSFKLISKAFGSSSRQRNNCNSDIGVAASHACGEQATG